MVRAPLRLGGHGARNGGGVGSVRGHRGQLDPLEAARPLVPLQGVELPVGCWPERAEGHQLDPLGGLAESYL